MRPDGWYRDRIEHLSGFMTPDREQTLRNVLSQRTRYMAVCMENTFHPQNASALVRHCDAFGIQDIYTIEALCSFKPNVDIVRGTDKWVTFHRNRTTAQAIDALKKEGYSIVATSPHENGTTPEEFDVAQGKFALVFGTEHEGISPEVMASADRFLRIPMWGFVESLNVSACAAILIYMLSRKIREGSFPWQLSGRESDVLLFDWMKKSIRGSDKILARFDSADTP